MKELGKHLAKLRKKNQYTQKDLAKELNVSQQVISNIERGFSAPDIEFLKKLADLYDISLDTLVNRDYLGINVSDIEQRIISCIKQMDDKGKELSLGLVSQVIQHQDNDNGNE